MPSLLSPTRPQMPIMKHPACLTILACVVIATWVCGCTSTQSSPVPSQPAAMTTAAAPSNGPGRFSLQVDALAPGSVLPDMYTCKGAMESPELSWENIPTGTKSLVLIVDDPDAPKGTFTHWLLYNIPPVKPADRPCPDQYQGACRWYTAGRYQCRQPGLLSPLPPTWRNSPLHVFPVCTRLPDRYADC